MAPIKVGSKAPKFALPDKEGTEISLKSLLSKNVVLYFYPKDSTPGCTVEANEFNARLKKFEELGFTIVGISGGNSRSKQRFCDAQKLNFTLLSDSDYTVSSAYGAYGTKKFMGRTYQGILRKTFMIDRQGKVTAIFDDVSPAGHAEEVLAAVVGSAVVGPVGRKTKSNPAATKKKR